MLNGPSSPDISVGSVGIAPPEIKEMPKLKNFTPLSESNEPVTNKLSPGDTAEVNELMKLLGQQQNNPQEAVKQIEKDIPNIPPEMKKSEGFWTVFFESLRDFLKNLFKK